MARFDQVGPDYCRVLYAIEFGETSGAILARSDH
jgi:hypothetical protein